MDLREEWENCLKLLRVEADAGWPRHECIPTGTPGTQGFTPTFDHPIWDGSEKSITLLVNADFGMGDTIHFYRFIAAAQQRVKRLILRCDRDLHTLFGSTETCSVDDPLPEFDEIIHMMALPRVLGIGKQDVSGARYLSPNYDEKLAASLYLFDLMRFTKIGVCWAGNPFSPRDKGRSIPVELFKSWTDQGMKLFSLSKTDPAPDGFFDMRDYMQNWNHTAYLLTYMDLVISVDTAIAHLAGALGAQTALLVSTKPDWRWKDVGDTTRWYDNVSIFRQKDEGDWVELLARLYGLIQAS